MAAAAPAAERWQDAIASAGHYTGHATRVAQVSLRAAAAFLAEPREPVETAALTAAIATVAVVSCSVCRTCLMAAGCVDPPKAVKPVGGSKAKEKVTAAVKEIGGKMKKQERRQQEEAASSGGGTKARRRRGSAPDPVTPRRAHQAIDAEGVAGSPPFPEHVAGTPTQMELQEADGVLDYTLLYAYTTERWLPVCFLGWPAPAPPSAAAAAPMPAC